ncbi:hypothetical protein HMI54_013945 [Coelomomyces lativittatus]|nr:hypothetical protein HMI54_013945 [Coelomomyces lativittatus]KAJ1497429.1 hypothetical protein HMI56_005626 [Coelomomyces lativittatus]KAJ1500531.1 hypothetical protein HMI55_003846 [Coelomomyces lativittatus]
MEVPSLPQSVAVNVNPLETDNEVSNQLSQPSPSEKLNNEVSPISAPESSSNESVDKSNPGITLASPKKTRSFFNPTLHFTTASHPTSGAVHRLFQSRNPRENGEGHAEVPRKRRGPREIVSFLSNKTFQTASQIKSEVTTYAKTKANRVLPSFLKFSLQRSERQ